MQKDFYIGERKNFPLSVTGSVETPCFLVNEDLLIKNLEILGELKRRTGSKVLLALKAFAMHSTFPTICRYLDGICASGPMEARLGYEKFGKEVHTSAVAYSDKDINESIKYSDVLILNSIEQWKKYKPTLLGSKRKIEIGLRVNPGWSEVETDLYNPVISGSRLGISVHDLRNADLEGIDGLHFHALCEQNADVLVRVLKSFERLFSEYIPRMKWINFGGGHHITRKDYDLDLLVNTINKFKKKYGVQVHLEPGEAIALNCGVLVSSVLDVVHNGVDIAILDTSAEAHMPDVLAQPYRPNIIGAGRPNELKHTYRLGGLTCLAGDIIGDYSFAKELHPGDRIVFLDMAHYTMVKSTTFNGVRHPSIILYSKQKGAKVIRKFGYKDYKDRLS